MKRQPFFCPQRIAGNEDSQVDEHRVDNRQLRHPGIAVNTINTI
jgi:hypothetical protein